MRDETNRRGRVPIVFELRINSNDAEFKSAEPWARAVIAGPWWK
jgi:hypothetical protein